jgi:hypothetical protein
MLVRVNMQTSTLVIEYLSDRRGLVSYRLHYVKFDYILFRQMVVTIATSDQVTVKVLNGIYNLIVAR